MDKPIYKKYVVRVFNDKYSSNRYYDEYFFNEYEAYEFYKRMSERGFQVTKY